MISHVFISYVRENTDIVSRLSHELPAAGVKVWLDRYSIKPGANWRNAIRLAIRQTHDATLVLETKFSRRMDVKTLIKNFSDSEAERVDKPQSKKFMKQRYVAMSRPRKVLCLAVHKNSIAGHEDDLRALGWKIEIVDNCV